MVSAVKIMHLANQNDLVKLPKSKDNRRYLLNISIAAGLVLGTLALLLFSKKCKVKKHDPKAQNAKAQNAKEQNDKELNSKAQNPKEHNAKEPNSNDDNENERKYWVLFQSKTNITPDVQEEEPFIKHENDVDNNNEIHVYITDMGTKYHLNDCMLSRKSKTEILLSDAKAKGYTPCSVCKPPV
jgi:hypothetical protein